MKKFIKIYLSVFAGLFASLLPNLASAHEAYVVSSQYFWQEMLKPLSFEAFKAWENYNNVILTLEVVLGILILLILNYLFRLSKTGLKFHAFLERFNYLGPIFVRVAISAAFFFGAMSQAFLGPELSIRQMIFPELLRWALFTASFMIFFGIFTEIAAVIGLLVFSIGFFTFGAYLATYLNYLGELIALLLFGMRSWSFDALIFGHLKGWRKYWEKYETSIVRIFYGLALMYAAINVKLLHTELSLHVVTAWNLTQFHFLFPSDPLLLVLGAALAEFVIGFFILVGFEMRITVFISLFYITLSLLYFRELVWPHILLYGISFNLIIQPEIFTIDHILFKKHAPKNFL